MEDLFWNIKSPKARGGKKTKQASLLPTAVELFNRTQLVEELLIDQSGHQQETVARDKLINGLLFHPPGLRGRNQTAFLTRCTKQQDKRTSIV